MRYVKPYCVTTLDGNTVDVVGPPVKFPLITLLLWLPAFLIGWGLMVAPYLV